MGSAVAGTIGRAGSGPVLEPRPLEADVVLTNLADAAVERMYLGPDGVVTGNVSVVGSGALTLMAGGDPSVIARVQPVLAASSSRVVHIGGRAPDRR